MLHVRFTLEYYNVMITQQLKCVSEKYYHGSITTEYSTNSVSILGILTYTSNYIPFSNKQATF